MEFTKVGTEQFVLLVTGAALFLFAPVIIALIWTIRKKERFTTILVGAAAFLLFALILEKPIQNVLVFPIQMGLPEHTASQFINARPVLWAFIVGLFPGVFEETGRFVAFRTALKNRKNRETSISYGIGHGGFEVMLITGLTYISNIIYAFMINTGAFQTVVDQVIAQAPDQVDQVYEIATQLAAFSFADLGMSVMERIFAFLFHVGASILVFYACREKKYIWLYPFAIVLHTVMNGILALTMFDVIRLSTWEIEGIVAVFACLTFLGAYFLLYNNDKKLTEEPSR